jgi:hypothetical protein
MNKEPVPVLKTVMNSHCPFAASSRIILLCRMQHCWGPVIIDFNAKNC